MNSSAAVRVESASVKSRSAHWGLAPTPCPPPPAPSPPSQQLLSLARAASLPGMWERTLTIGSAGKTFSATGWKVSGRGWGVAPPPHPLAGKVAWE